MQHASNAGTPPGARPYFLPDSLDFESLPEGVQAAFREIIEPVYRSLVLNAASPLERSAGATLTFLLSSELLEQFGLGQLLNYSGLPDASDAEQRERRMRQYLRLVSAKQQVADFLIRLQVLRTKFGPPAWPSP